MGFVLFFVIEKTDRKESLQDREVLVIGDFSENYSFFLQDAAQGYHWNNAQAPLHPFVAYFREDGAEYDCLIHDAVAVHLFQKQLVTFLIEKTANPSSPFWMVLLPSIRTAKFSSISAITKWTLMESTLNGFFLLPRMARGPCDRIGGKRVDVAQIFFLCKYY